LLTSARPASEAAIVSGETKVIGKAIGSETVTMTTMIATMIGAGGAAMAEDIGAAMAESTGVGTDALMVIIADRDTTVAGAAGCIGMQ
jgi:hypothetical protein